MSVHRVHPRPAREAQAPVRVQGTSALKLDRARATALQVALEAPPSRPESSSPAGRPSRVRALPVAVPRRRRPAHPTRAEQQGNGKKEREQQGRLQQQSTSMPTQLWEDVRPWGVQAETARSSRSVRSSGTAHSARTAQPVPSVLAARSSASWLTRPVALVVAGALAAAGLGVGLAVTTASEVASASVAQQAPQESLQQVVVAPGQTLWQIAAAHTAEGQDVRDTAAVIAAANALRGGQVRAGQVLTIPQH